MNKLALSAIIVGIIAIINEYLFLTVLERKFPFGSKMGMGKNAVIMGIFALFCIGYPLIYTALVIGFYSNFSIPVRIAILLVFGFLYCVVLGLGALDIKRRRGSFFT